MILTRKDVESFRNNEFCQAAESCRPHFSENQAFKQKIVRLRTGQSETSVVSTNMPSVYAGNIISKYLERMLTIIKTPGNQESYGA